MAGQGRWDDLVTRVLSGGTVAGLGLTSVWFGGIWFQLFVSISVGLMTWELARMLGAGDKAIWPGLATGSGILISSYIPEGFALPLILLPALFRTESMTGNRTQFSIYTAAIVLAGFGFIHLRDDFGAQGFTWLLWLALIVIATDVGGYFAGRTFGGPKIWPRISPKKTWSGTVAGWIASALISIPFVLGENAGWELLGYAVAVSLASQIGDVSESSIKRRAGVKDSSNLIPGHGGLMDRFDSMLGGSLFLLLTERMVDFPPPPIL